MEDIKVTVYVDTFNQEAYLRQALDSAITQKTDFRYEILIADDCSSDGTQAIAMEYKEKYPELISTYFTPVNVGANKKLTNCIDMGLLRGEYLAQLEGDDYWIGEDRLQTLVDFLDTHHEYSRVGHNRTVIDQYGNEKGIELPESAVKKVFTIKDFLDGKQYSSASSVGRNYFKTCGDKYHSILHASRNVGDFQNMFITQEYGPVYVMDKIFGVYRSRSAEGESNYNSIVKQEARRVDKINIAKAVEEFYGGRYDLTPRIRREQRKLFAQAVDMESDEIMAIARSVTDSATAIELFAEVYYKAMRCGNAEKKKYIKKQMTRREKTKLPFAVVKYALERIYKKLRKLPYEDNRRGYIVSTQGENE